jgi:hypothetical protein
MKLLRPLAGHTYNDHTTNDSICHKLQTECIVDKIDEYRRNWLLHLQRMSQNRIPLKSYHYSPQGKKQLGDQRNVGESNCKFWRRNGPNGPALDVYDDDDFLMPRTLV